MYLVVTPWHKPEVFGRCWCLFEVETCLSLGAELSIVLSEKDEDAFEETLKERSGPRNIWVNLRQIDAQLAEAFSDKDKKMIFDLIRGGTGFKVCPCFLAVLSH